MRRWFYRLAVAQVHTAADADDVFQEVFLRYIRKPRRFESEGAPQGMVYQGYHQLRQKVLVRCLEAENRTAAGGALL